MPTPKKKPVNKASISDDIEPVLDEEMDEDEDIDPDALVDDDKEDADAVPEQLSVEEEEGEDPLVRAKDDDEEDEEAKKKAAEEEIGDGLEDEDGIKALNRAEKELHEMEFGSGDDAEEPEEEMI